MARPLREGGRFWVDSARSNLGDAEYVYKGGRYYLAVYLSQQAAEKALKAAVIHFKRKHATGHNLIRLHNQVKNWVKLPIEVRGELGVLSTAYMGTRYPNVSGGPPEEAYSKSNAEVSISIARGILKCVEDAVLGKSCQSM